MSSFPVSLPLVNPPSKGLRVLKPGRSPVEQVGPVEARLRRNGWLFGVPANLTEESARADADACTESDCPSCGHHGMLWRPYFKGNGYKAVSHCFACGFQEEL